MIQPNNKRIIMPKSIEEQVEFTGSFVGELVDRIDELNNILKNYELSNDDKEIIEMTQSQINGLDINYKELARQLKS